jgi:outer membrane protein assembly factor BamC
MSVFNWLCDGPILRKKHQPKKIKRSFVRMQKKISMLILAPIFLALGCEWLGIRDRSNDYLLEEETALITVPDGLNYDLIEDIFIIPGDDHNKLIPFDYEVPRPNPASVNTFEQVVKIQSFEDRRWILVNLPPSEIWPRVRGLLSRNGIPSHRVDAANGMIDTAWINLKSDEDKLHRFRIFVVPGIGVNSSEVSTLHDQEEFGADSSFPWPLASDSDDKGKEFLELVANDLAAVSDFSQVSLLAQNIGGEPRVNQVFVDVDQPFIEIILSYERSWASVNYSLSRGGFSVLDKNRSEGFFLVDYKTESLVNDSFLSKWFNFNSKDSKPKLSYKVIIKQLDNKVHVSITNLDGSYLDVSDTTRLLAILRSNLS